MSLFQKRKQEPEPAVCEASAATDGQNEQTRQAMDTKQDGKEGLFSLSYEEDGVYFVVEPAENGDTAVAPDKVADYLKRKEVDGADMALVASLIKKSDTCHEKIAEPQKEKKLDEEISVELSDDRMQAFLTFHAGEEGGKTLSVEEVLDQMSRIYKVKAGVDEEQIAFLLEGKLYGQKIPVAKGKQAVDGENGKLTFHFSMDDFLKVDEEQEDRIDFRNVMKFEKTDEKQVLVSRTFATPGSDGYDVLGTRLPAKRGKDVSLPAGKNVFISEDKSQLIAKISGKASYIGGRVSVLPHVKISGDVDMSVGNIDFDGDVVIGGNVKSGFIVKSSGSITVQGIVEAATLISGGDIVIKSGVSGASKGKLEAENDVVTSYMERTEVSAGGNVISGSVLHCRVVCEGAANVVLGKGALIGGYTSAGKHIAAKTIGTEAGIETVLEVGALPKKRQRLKELEAELKSVSAKIDRLELALQQTQKNTSQEAGKARLDVVIKISQMKKQQETMKMEAEELSGLMAGAGGGCVHVLDRIYPGVKIHIGSVTTPVSIENQYVTYNRLGPDITSTPCRFDPQTDPTVKRGNKR